MIALAAMLWALGALMPPSQALLADEREPTGIEGRQPGRPPALPAQAGRQANQLFQGELRVRAGQVVRGDTVVYDGDVWVESGGRIDGNLVVFRGDVTIAEGATVDGNIDLFSGNAVVGGTVAGDLALWNGNVALQGSARITGSLSVLNGEIERAAGAQVGGGVVEGPRLGFGGAGPERAFGFNFGFGDGRQLASRASGPFSFIQWLGAFLARLLGAVLLTGFVAVLVGLMVHVRPDVVAGVRTRMVDQPAVSFVIGLVVNLVLAFLGGLLALTICLLPIALAPMLALLAVNLMGWAALAQLVGERIEESIERPMERWAAAAIGAVVITAGFALLWAFGGFFRFVGGAALLFVASFGAGAVLMPWVRRIIQRRPMAPTSPSQAAAPPPAAASGDVSAARGFGRGPIQPAGTVPDVVTPAADAVPGGFDELSSQSGDAGADAAAHEDDFTALKGVGPVIDGRLKDAGIRTFGQLAALEPATLAEIIGWTEERVVRSEILEQARRAAAS